MRYISGTRGSRSRWNDSFVTTLAVLWLSVSVSGSVLAGEPDHELNKTSSATSYMVVAAEPRASKIGLQVLRAGGSAADAAVAVQIALNLFEPQSSGIGGGAFMLYWDASSRELSTIDGREEAPAQADEDYWLNADGEPVAWWEAVVGGRSVGVPGTLRLLETAHSRHGRLPWRDLFQPSINAASDGFKISPRLANSIASAKKNKLDLFEPTRSYFFNSDGSPKKAGETLTNPDFARTLRSIAEQGADVFYDGAIAGDIVAAVKTPINPGIMTQSDLAQYDVFQTPPVCVPYREFRVCGMGPPTSGGLSVGMILGLLERFDLPSIGPGARSAHLFAEAAKLTYADRALYMADDRYVDVPTRGLLDPTYLRARSQLIDPLKAIEKAVAGAPPWFATMNLAPDLQQERPGTSHFVIRDRYGDMVSMTTTIETGFGSRVMTGGFLLNNELTDFSRAPEKDGRKIANRVEAGKRPRSSMSPTVVFRNGEPFLLIGSPGGSRIINYVAQALISILDFGMSPLDAISAGHVVNRNGKTDLEEGTSAVEFQAELESLGQEINVRPLGSGLHVIRFNEDGSMTGAADPRREGVALGGN